MLVHLCRWQALELLLVCSSLVASLHSICHLIAMKESYGVGGAVALEAFHPTLPLLRISLLFAQIVQEWSRIGEVGFELKLDYISTPPDK